MFHVRRYTCYTLCVCICSYVLLNVCQVHRISVLLRHLCVCPSFCYWLLSQYYYLLCTCFHVLQYAQQRSSVYNIARTYGLKVPGQRPSVALVDFSITVPAFGDKEDERYLGVLTRGSQFTGGGIVFENINDIDFASPYNSQGFPNRLKIPNFNANNVLINYTITKRELVVNGITKVFKRVITPNDVRPF